ncbi:thioredoxin family protein [Streptomyces sp. NPDC001795]|uniref:thioredoxin family protein n=1 Tax=unclassified Streptomyces TaxID=2593676 RepID=UPI00332F00F8
MELTVLVVRDCPSIRPLSERLELALNGRTDVSVTWREVADADEAEQLGMHGSPTLLVDGVDPLARPGQRPSLSCRVGALPSVDHLHQILAGTTPA